MNGHRLKADLSIITSIRLYLYPTRVPRNREDEVKKMQCQEEKIKAEDTEISLMPRGVLISVSFHLWHPSLGYRYR